MNNLNLLQLAQSYESDMVRFLQALIQLPSVNGRDTEKAVAERIVAEAEKLGLAGELVAKDPNRPNAVARWGHGSAKFAIIGHSDTVAEGDHSHWSHAPFGGEIADGRMFGRGSADNKAGIAIGLYLLALIRDHNLLDPNDVEIIVAGVVDEESGATSTLGVRHLLEAGQLAGVKGAIYAYASDIVCVGHRGSLRLELTARGEATHTGLAAWSQGKKGVNAVTGLAAVLLALENLDIPAPAHPAFDHLGCTITPGTLMRGGAFVSMVPDLATAAVDIRLMPGQDKEVVLEIIQGVIDGVVAHRPGLTVSTSVTNSFPGAAIPSDHKLAQIAQVQARTFTDGDWPIVGAGPGNEGYMLIGAGIPTLCGFGPAGDNAHAPDEWVDVASLSTTLATFAGIVQGYLSA
ncbi:MAG: succinyl-diaminopimelate desuccinylase [Cellvibrionaceae bacterium]|jgi:succinyl-diaminopimelate desuccinylase